MLVFVCLFVVVVVCLFVCLLLLLFVCLFVFLDGLGQFLTVQSRFTSLRFKMVSTGSGKPIRAPHFLSKVPPYMQEYPFLLLLSFRVFVPSFSLSPIDWNNYRALSAKRSRQNLHVQQ